MSVLISRFFEMIYVNIFFTKNLIEFIKFDLIQSTKLKRTIIFREKNVGSLCISTKLKNYNLERSKYYL